MSRDYMNIRSVRNIESASGWAGYSTNLTSTKRVALNRLRLGAVVWAHIPFAERAGEKIRPAVVLSASTHQVSVLPMTTSMRRFRIPELYVEVKDLGAAGLTRSTGIGSYPVVVDRIEVVDLVGTLAAPDLERMLAASTAVAA